MSRYNVYVPMLLRMANDVDENPGPTIYVFDPSKTICAGASIKEYKNKQCVAMSLTEIIHNKMK